jgi:TrmH family RNA methyltransferase
VSTARSELRVSTRNARFQQWQALLDNRSKRHRGGHFLVQGVRPISLAVEHGWTVEALLFDASRRLSDWAEGLLREQPEAQRVAMAPELLAELGEKDTGVPELLALVSVRDTGLRRLAERPDALGVVLDRPSSPGNIGTMVRSADAFGADALVVTGHAADLYDPKAVRAATGSLFALPTHQADSAAGFLDSLAALRGDGAGSAPRVVGTDETGTVEVAEVDLTGPVLIVVGNEASGMSKAWRDRCDVIARIPMAGSASSLNAAAAATVVLYEASRQRRQA